MSSCFCGILMETLFNNLTSTSVAQQNVMVQTRNTWSGRWLQLLFALLCLNLHPAHAQPNVDSLYVVWQDTSQTDSSRAFAFNLFIGYGYLNQDPDTARILASELLSFSSDKDLPYGQGMALNLIGISYLNQSEDSLAADYLNQSLEIQRTIENERGVANALNNLGMIYDRQGKLELALENYRESLQYFDANSAINRANTLMNMGQIYQKLYDYNTAQIMLDSSIQVFRELNYPYGIASVQLNAGILSFLQGDLTESVASLQPAQVFFAKNNYPLQNINALQQLAQVYALQGEFQLASDLLLYALDISVVSDLPKKKANLLVDLGATKFNVGKYKEGIDTLEKVIDMSRELGDQILEASARTNLGIIYEYQGEFVLAVLNHQQAERIYRDKRTLNELADCLTNIGNLYRKNDEPSQSLNYYEQALQIFDQTANKSGIADLLANIGNVYGDQEQLDVALEYLDSSQRLQEIVGNRNAFANGLFSMGVIYANQHKFSEALEHYRESLQLSREIGHIQGEAVSIINIGKIHLFQNRNSEAISTCNQGYELSQKIGDIASQREACDCLYKAHRARGDLELALPYYEEYNFLSDSLKVTETAKALQRMEYEKYRLRDSLKQVEDQARIELAHQEEVHQKEKTSNILLGSGILLFLIAVGLLSRNRYITRSKQEIQQEKDRSDELLLNILPSEIAEELKAKGEAMARQYENVSILFSDFKGFTEASERMTAPDLVAEIDTCFKAFDLIIGKYQIEKIKTIGDAYMAAGGLPVPEKESVHNTILAGLEMQRFMQARKTQRDSKNLPAFEMRLGIHTGPVVAGIVGVKKFQYDVWGDTVNTASRMESYGEIGKVNISATTYELVKGISNLSFTSRGQIEVKGKGLVSMYFVTQV